MKVRNKINTKVFKLINESTTNILPQPAEGIMLILNATENAIRSYARKFYLPDIVAMQHFATICNYKSANHFYDVFKLRKNYELKHTDTITIVNELRVKGMIEEADYIISSIIKSHKWNG